MAGLTKKQILDKKDDPERLEDLYRSAPENFRETLLSLAKDKPRSKLFEFWAGTAGICGQGYTPACGANCSCIDDSYFLWNSGQDSRDISF